jgi:hypothetical protein
MSTFAVMGGIMMSKINVTIRLEEDVYVKYRQYCIVHGIQLSRSIEIFMETKMNEEIVK